MSSSLSLDPTHDPNSPWFNNASGYRTYLNSEGTNLQGGQNVTGSQNDLSIGQNQQSLQGLAGSGAVGAAGNRNQLASLNKQYYGGGVGSPGIGGQAGPGSNLPLSNYGQNNYNPYASSGYLGYGTQPTYPNGYLGATGGLPLGGH